MQLLGVVVHMALHLTHHNGGEQQPSAEQLVATAGIQQMLLHHHRVDLLLLGLEGADQIQLLLPLMRSA